MTKEQALEFEQEFLNGDYVDHVDYSLAKSKGKFWYANLAKKYNLKLKKNTVVEEEILEEDIIELKKREKETIWKRMTLKK